MTRASLTRRAAALLLVAAALGATLTPARAETAPPDVCEAAVGPPVLSYDELVELYWRATPAPALARRMDAVLTEPFVSNAASDRGVAPIRPSSPRLGRFLRVAEWNVERGLELDRIALALSDPEALLRAADEEAACRAARDGRRAKPRKAADRARVLDQARALARADVIVLNEVDRGMKRTGYRDVAAELAAALDMNYAFGVEFLEVDPISLGIDADGDGEVDPARYEGMHGSAILSRYRLENVRLVPFETRGYDWYARERTNISPLERGRRLASDKILDETVTREVRRGGRMMLVADVADPELPTGAVTVVATHLEDKARPERRVEQLEELLELASESDHPVVLAGDMNTNGSNVAPISVAREIKRRVASADFWVKRGIFLAAGIGFVGGFAIGVSNVFRTLNDPTVRDVRYVAENPEKGFFDALRAFRMRGGGAIDMRGDRARSFGGREKTLANSAERARKGFVPTFRVARNIARTGEFKLDWIFVASPFIAEPDAEGQSYRFAPHFGRTLVALNECAPERLSDHAPILLDLPLDEPPPSVGQSRER